jgi:hypothetical protein
VVGDASVSTPNGLERLALILHWNGRACEQVPTPNPAPSTMPASSVSNILAAVSGSSSRDVWAVGQYYLWANGIRGSRALVLHWDAWAVGGMNRRGAQHALAERWNGARWSAVRTTGPHLAGVSALAASGSYAGPGMVMHWNGHVWTVATKLTTRHGLAAVAEVSPADVWAVGGQFTH